MYHKVIGETLVDAGWYWLFGLFPIKRCWFVLGLIPLLTHLAVSDEEIELFLPLNVSTIFSQLLMTLLNFKVLQNIHQHKRIEMVYMYESLETQRLGSWGEEVYEVEEKIRWRFKWSFRACLEKQLLWRGVFKQLSI